MSILVRIIKKYYEENSRHQCGPPPKLLRELQFGRLVLSDYEIGDEDTAVLIRFFNNKRAWENVRKIEINRFSGGKVNQRGTTSALNQNNSKLLKELIIFISKCEKLEMLSFESIRMSEVLFGYLGKALASGCSELRWLLFRSCQFEGDSGLMAITPHLGKLSLQMLAFEFCELTDQSFSYLISILKAQEINLDALYWNCTLRLSEQDLQQLNHTDEINKIYANGLVGLSLIGNQFTGRGILSLARVIKKSNWLLALNLADNQIDELNIAIFIDEIKENPLLQSILLRGNPGYTLSSAQTIYATISATNRPAISGLLSSQNRLKVLSPRACWLVKTWMRLQSEEVKDLLEHRLNNEFYSSTAAHNQASHADYNASTISIRSHVSRSQYQLSAEEVAMQKYRKVYSSFGYLDDNETSSTTDIQRSSKTNGVSDVFQVEKAFDMVLQEVNQEDNFESGIPMRSPLQQSSDDLLEYFQSDGQTKNRQRNFVDGQQRPPSRISIRPRSVDFLESRELIRSVATSNDKQQLHSFSVSNIPRYMFPKDALLSRSIGNFTEVKRKGNEPKRVNSFNQLSCSDSKLTRSCVIPATSHRHKSPTQNNDNRRPWIPSSTHASQSSVEIQNHPPADEALYANLTNPRKVELQKESLPNHLRARRKKGKKQLPSKQLNNASNAKPKTAIKKKRAMQNSQQDTVQHETSGTTKTAEILGDISIRVLEATKNLEHMSKHLLGVAESLSESALLNLSNDRHQSRLISDSGDVNASVLPAMSTMVFPIESIEVATKRTDMVTSHGHDGKVRNVSSPIDFHEISHANANGRNHSEVATGMLDISQMSEFTSQDVSYIADMVKRRMHAKLKSLLQSQVGIVHHDDC